MKSCFDNLRSGDVCIIWTTPNGIPTSSNAFNDGLIQKSFLFRNLHGNSIVHFHNSNWVAAIDWIIRIEKAL